MFIYYRSVISPRRIFKHFIYLFFQSFLVLPISDVDNKLWPGEEEAKKCVRQFTAIAIEQETGWQAIKLAVIGNCDK